MIAVGEVLVASSQSCLFHLPGYYSYNTHPETAETECNTGHG